MTLRVRRVQEMPDTTRPTSKLDEIDRGLLAVLQKNGRTTNIELARLLGVSEATIRNRLGRLLREDLINIVAVPTPRAVGLTVSAIIGLSVTLPLLQDITDVLSKTPEVRYVGVSTGRYDLILEAFFADHDHLLGFLADRIGVLEGVRDVETSIILKVAKFSYEWEVPPS